MKKTQKKQKKIFQTFMSKVLFICIGVFISLAIYNTQAALESYKASSGETLTANKWNNLLNDMGHSLDSPDGTKIDALSVDNDGEVGIGTTDPQADLHIKGNGRLRLEDNTVSLELIDDDDEIFRFFVDNDNLKIQSKSGWSTDIMTLDKDGDVRMKDGDLTIDNLSGSGDRCVFAESDGTLDVKNFDCGSGAGSISIGSSIGNSPIDGSVLFVGNSGKLTQDNTNLFWDNTDNKLGIGTSTPDGRLDVEGGAIYLSEIAAPATPNSSKGVLYVKSDGNIYFKDDNGNEYNLTTDGSATYAP